MCKNPCSFLNITFIWKISSLPQYFLSMHKCGTVLKVWPKYDSLYSPMMKFEAKLLSNRLFFIIKLETLAFDITQRVKDQLSLPFPSYLDSLHAKVLTDTVQKFKTTLWFIDSACLTKYSNFHSCRTKDSNFFLKRQEV